MENQIENLKESNLLTKRNIITGLGIIVMLVALGAGIVLIKERQVFRSRADTGSGCGLPGDANGDGRVNNADHLIWKSEKNTPGGTTQADFDYNGKVDQKDYQILRKNLNRTCPTPTP